MTGNRRTVRRPDELVTAILVPMPAARVPARRSSSSASRAYLVISIAMVAAVVDLGCGRTRRLGADRRRAPAPRCRCGSPAAEARLVGAGGIASSCVATIEPADLAGLAPIDDVRGTAAYRRDVALMLVRRAVTELVA